MGTKSKKLCKKLYIIGAGGFGREVSWLVERINADSPSWEIAGFIDDDLSLQGNEERGYPVLGGCGYFEKLTEEVWAVCAIGSAKIRRQVTEKLRAYTNIRFASLIDPSVIISEENAVGEGTVICAGSIITVGISIGNHVIINVDCTVGHDDSIQDFVTLYPSVNVSGNVRIEQGVELGTGTQVIQGKKIGRDTIVGAGAVVIRDLPERCVAVGIPAKPIKFLKTVLMAATVPSMIGQFNMENICLLLNMGYKVDVACNFNDTSVWPKERTQKLKNELAGMDVDCIQLDFSRNPVNIKSHISSYRKAVNILKTKKYDFIHTHTPIASAIVRIAAHTAHTKVIYTAHGFHFYKGGPLKNWLLFYPIEKFLSRWTNVLITINKEDYHRAKTRFSAAKTVYIPGVGIDIGKFSACAINQAQKRRSLGLKEDDFVLLSVGELSERKNQKIVIEALHKMAEEGTIANIVYLAVGRGEMQESLERIINVYGLNNHVKLVGFRSDIDELCEMADCFVHPSVKEGLGIAPLEAMAAGLPVISADVIGIKDYTKDGVTGCCVDPADVNQMVAAIKKMRDNEDFRKKCMNNNLRIAKKFDIENIKEIMSEIYQGGYKHLKAVLIRRQKREELGIGLDDFLILSVGELSANKNHQVIIRALKETDDLDMKYIIAGKGEQQKKLDKLVKELGLSGKVKLLGFRGDIPELLQASDCFAFPSKREGLGIAAVEAMAAGLPLVASASGGIKDYCVSGTTGYMSKKGTAKEYKSLLEKVKSCDEIKPADLKTYSSKFDGDCVRKIMESVYKRI